MSDNIETDQSHDEVVLPNFLRADAAGGVPEILEEMAHTYRERNKEYGNNYKMVGPMMEILFPEGVHPDLLHSDHFHLFELILVKLSRFAISDLTHIDSIHDAAVYGAMIESILQEHLQK